ncbi:MAG: carbamoyltransferase HypF [Chloroflexota bacterium]
MTGTQTISSVHVAVRGVVQGVGFRPFVYQLASRHNLKGWVCNTSEGVRIEAEGDAVNIERFLAELPEQAPPRSHIEDISVTQHPSDRARYDTFEIRHSIAKAGKYQLISPDIATCPECLGEVFDPADRRYGYPFTNCTNCGPRFTIIRDIPYDRPSTTMSRFKMCPECQREYDDPADRRFHAQPNACPACGPSLELADASGKPVDCPDAIAAASRLLKEGNIIAVKGLGGFLLACDATSEATVSRLRTRKHRPSKPLAVMVSSLEEAGQHCDVNEAESGLLASAASPIVLLKWKRGSSIAAAVAPGLKYLGVILPYTPLHHLLLRQTGLPLVMTSGNLSEEPIAKDNDEALRRLSGIADYFLLHDRDIYARYDDSVTMVAQDKVQVIRRARGYAPYPIRLACNSRQVLGCGAEEKNTFCLTRDNYAFLSQHIGDMENLETLEHFENTIALYKRLFRIEPEVIAYDLHPEYLATKYARRLAAEQGLKAVGVQHHHAHIAGCLADNGLEGPVIGVALDGTGYGSDGHIWGGEFMIADCRRFTRVGHFEYLPLPGGALAIKKPYRITAGYLLSLFDDPELPFLKQMDTTEFEIIKTQVRNRINSPLTSSCGRLFDAVSALLGVRREIDYEAQAAIELEMLADDAENGSYPFAVDEHEGMSLLRLRELLAAIMADQRRGTPKAVISARFHNTIAQMILDLCQLIAAKTGLRRVALSGGVFQNRLLLTKTIARLEPAGFEVLTHRHSPCNDGGISLGQVVIANFTTG